MVTALPALPKPVMVGSAVVNRELLTGVTIVGTCAVVGLATTVKLGPEPGITPTYGVNTAAPAGSDVTVTVDRFAASWPNLTRKFPFASVLAVATTALFPS